MNKSIYSIDAKSDQSKVKKKDLRKKWEEGQIFTRVKGIVKNDYRRRYIVYSLIFVMSRFMSEGEVVVRKSPSEKARLHSIAQHPNQDITVKVREIWEREVGKETG